MIITNFPKQVILSNNTDNIHILPDETNSYIIKLNDKNFSFSNDGAVSINIKVVDSIPEEIDDNFIYLVSSSNVINSITNEEKEKLNKIVINEDGDKFLSNDGTYKAPFIKTYYNFDDFTSNDLLNTFNEMIYPSLLYAEIINDNNYPYPTGQLTMMKISDFSAVLVYTGLDQNVYTATINNNVMSDWKSDSEADTANKLKYPVRINQALFDGSYSISASDMDVAIGNNCNIDLGNLPINTWIRFAKCTNIATGEFFLQFVSSDLSFNLNFDLAFNAIVTYHQSIYDCIEDLNNKIRIVFKDNEAYVELNVDKEIIDGVLRVDTVTQDWGLISELSINNDTTDYIINEFNLISNEETDLISISRNLVITEEWTNCGINSESGLQTGSYMLQLAINNNIYTGMISWYEESIENGEQTNEIYLHHSGGNITDENIYLRTIQDTNLELQICSNVNIPLTECKFVFKKML